MAGFEQLFSRAPVPEATPLPRVQEFQPRTATAGAMVRAGSVLQGIGLELQEARNSAQIAQSTTAYLEGAAKLDRDFQNDPDPATASKRYQDAELQMRRDVLGRVADPIARQKLETQLTRYGVVNQAQANQVFLRREADRYGAGLDAQQVEILNRAQRAASPAERAEVTNGYFATVDDGVAKGWITAQQAQARKAGISRALDDSDAVAQIEKNPQAAIAALNDPSKFTTLTPEQRQARIAQAQARADGIGVAAARNAAAFDPARGIAMVGRVTGPGQIAAIVDRALIPQESGGNPNAVSSAGAAGLTQFIPDTARAVAKKMGMPGLDGLDDAGVREVLKNRPVLARALAVQHLGDLAARYDGRLAPAFAAYHAGQGNADKWHAAAVERFGIGYTAAEFASVVPDSVTDGQKKTKDYVADMFRRLGADPATTPRFSQAGAFQAASAVGQEVDSQLAGQKRVRDLLASTARDDAGDIVASYKAGYAQDPQLVAQTRATLTTAAAAGDVQAARKLQELEYAGQIAPEIRRAFVTPPAQLEQEIGAERARLGQLGHVSPFERFRLDAMETVLATVTRERNSNPVGLLERAGATPIALPLDLAAPDMAQALAMRSQQALAAQARFGGEVQPFKPQEAAQLKQAFGDATADAQFGFVAKAAAAMPDGVYEKAMAALGADKLTITAGRLALSDPSLGQRVARGAALLREKGVDDGKSADLRLALENTLGTQVFPAGMQSDLINAALAVYAADRAGSGTLFSASDQRGIESAIETVTGKLIKLNGVKVPLPQGMSEATFERAIGNLSPADLGGVPTGRDGQPIDLPFLRGHARLRPNSYPVGRYLVMLPGPRGEDAAVLDGQGRPLTIDVPAIAKRSGAFIQRESAAAIRRDTIYRGIFGGAGP